MSLTKVEGHDNLFKDSRGVVVNINKEDIIEVQARRQERKDQEAEHKQLVETVKSLEGEMSEIKTLLTKLVEKI